MDHYDLPIFMAIGNSQKFLNTFFMAKYGVFTCYDAVHHIGLVPFDYELITFWERKHGNIKYIWYLAMLYALNQGGITAKDLAPYRKSYKESRRYKQYLARHPDHESDVNNYVHHIKFKNVYDKIEEKNPERAQQIEVSILNNISLEPEKKN